MLLVTMERHIGLHIADGIVKMFVDAGFSVYIKKSKPIVIAASGSANISMHEIRNRFGVSKVEENNAFYEAHKKEFEIPESSCAIA